MGKRNPLYLFPPRLFVETETYSVHFLLGKEEPFVEYLLRCSGEFVLKRVLRNTGRW